MSQITALQGDPPGKRTSPGWWEGLAGVVLETIGWSVLSGGAIYVLQLLVSAPSLPSWAQNLLCLFASVGIGTLVAVIRRLQTTTQKLAGDVQRYLEQLNGNLSLSHSMCRARIELVYQLTGLYEFFESLKARNEADERLAQVLMTRVSGHVWRIPQAVPALGYRVLTEALTVSNLWEGIHASDLKELGHEPLDHNEGVQFFEALRSTEIKKRRIIIVTKEEFALYKSPEALDVDRAKKVQDFWHMTGSAVDCYFFNKDHLSIPLNAGNGQVGRIPPNKLDELYDRQWPDCAVYNTRYLIAFQRTNNGLQSSVREGVVEVWTADLSPRKDSTKEEEWVAYLARAVRKLFDFLESEKWHVGHNKSDHFIRIDEPYVKRVNKVLEVSRTPSTGAKPEAASKERKQ